MLGVLVRGTDYFAANLPFKPVSKDKIISIINEKLEKNNYDGIFVVTEDSDYLNHIKNSFPKMIRAIAQTRYNIKDFKKSQIINELEKELYDGQEYDSIVEDTTVNYFYALLLLSKCESIISTPDCSGLALTRALNKGKFKNIDVYIESDVK